MAPTTKPVVAKKPPKALPPLEKPILKSKKTKNKTFNNFSIYLYKLLKSVSREESMGISRKAMLIMNNFVSDMLEKVASESGKLVAHSKKTTLGSREIQTAVKLLIPGELSKHANSESFKAITMYHNSKERDAS